MGEGSGVYRVLGRNLWVGDHWGDPDADGRMDLQEVGCGVLIGSSWLRIETGGGHL
jgi:hypothetical protein